MTVGVAILGGLIGKKMKLPAGALTGSIVSVVIYNVIAQRVYFPSGLRTYVQVASGALIGSRIKKEDFKGMGKLTFSGVLLVTSMLIMNISFGLLLYHFTGLDAATAFYGTAPGGMQDMGLISQDFGADPVIVSAIQLIRLVFILTCFPSFYRMMDKYIKNKKAKQMREQIKIAGQTNMGEQIKIEQQTKAQEIEKIQKGSDSNEEVKENSSKCNTLTNEKKSIRLILTVVAALVGGLLFKKIGVSGGALIGSMVFVAFLGIGTGKAFFPPKARTIIQIFAGAYIGAQIQSSSFQTMKTIIVPLIILCIGLLIFAVLIACMLSKVSGLDIISCMLMSTPGGLSEMCLLAEEFNCDTPKVVVMHTTRMVMVISLFPTILGKIVEIL